MFDARLLKSCLLVLLASFCAQGQVITTVAGGGWRAFPSVDIPALNAPLGTVWSPAVDTQGNVYVADTYNNVVVRISPGGTLTLIAGNGKAAFAGDGGPATGASLNFPAGLALDAAGNLYIADSKNNRVRKISGGIITTVAGDGVPRLAGDGGQATAASLYNPLGLAFDNQGNLYIADEINMRIRKVSGGVITTVAGSQPKQGCPANNPNCGGYGGDNGPATSALLWNPTAVAVDGANNLFIADSWNHRIRRVSGGNITTVAGNGVAGFSGDGTAVSQSLNYPEGVAVDSSGTIYIGDEGNNRVRKVSGGSMTTIAGTGASAFSGDQGPATSATLQSPTGVAIDSRGQLYIADFFNDRVRKVVNGVISTVAGQGTGSFFGDGGPPLSAAMLYPTNAVVDHNGNLYVSDFGNNCVRKVSGGVITTFAGTGSASYSGDGGPAASATLNGPSGLALDAAGNLYISDLGNNRVRKVSSGVITTVAGNGNPAYSGDNGPATSASLFGPQGLAVDAAGNLYIADSGNNRIRKVSGGTITTVAGTGVAGASGDGGAAVSATLRTPTGLAFDGAGNLYFSDTNNFKIRRISNAIINTVAGNGVEGYSGDGGAATNAMLDTPEGIAIDSAGNLFIADELNNRIRKVSAGTITTVAGNSTYAFSGDGGNAGSASIANPFGVAVDTAGEVFIVDTYNNRVREILNVPPSYQVSQTSLTFSASQGGIVPAAQQVNLASFVPGLPFTATSSAPWLSVSVSSGSIPVILQVVADPTNLQAGSYTGTITVATPNATPAMTVVSVSFTVQPTQPPQMTIGSPRESFGGFQGGTAQTAQLQISNSGGGVVMFSAAATTVDGASWLSVTPASASATPSAPSLLTVTADPGSLVPGTYTGAINITTAGVTTAVPVTLSVAAAAPIFLLTDSGLTFTAAAQGGAPLARTLGILNAGQGPLNWSATIKTLSGGNWLQISSTSGTANKPFADVSNISVSVDPSNLTPGTYYGQIHLTSPNASNSPQPVTVIFTVQDPKTPPGPDAQPASLIFVADAGTTPSSQDVTLLNSGSSANSYNSASSGKGFTYLAPSGNLAPGQPTTLRVFPDFTNLAPGEVDRGSITLNFTDGSSRSIDVLLVATPSASSSIRGPLSSCSPNPLNVSFQSPLPNISFSAQLNQTLTINVNVTDSCGKGLTTSDPAAAVQASLTGNGSVKLSYVNGVWHGTLTPSNAVNGQARIDITAVSSNATGYATLSGSLSTTPTPHVDAGGIVHAASFVSGQPIVPCGLITIKGSNLSDGVASANPPLQPTLDGTQVYLGDLNLPILYTSPGQLNVQVPCGATTNSNDIKLTVQRTTQASISVPEPLVVSQANPGIFTATEDGQGQGVIYRGNTQNLAQPGNPSVPGETVVIYCTGLGTVAPAVTDGLINPLSPLSYTVGTITVTIGGQNAPVAFSGLAPGGAPGVYQVNAVVPDGNFGDALDVVVTVTPVSGPSVSSKSVTMAVQPAQ